jgi:Protein of unknown function (DUF3987)
MLCAANKTDLQTTNPSRLLRLPGTLHLKGKAQLVTFEECFPSPYAFDLILDGIPEIPPVKLTKGGGLPHTKGQVCADMAWIDPNFKREKGWFERIVAIRCANILADDDGLMMTKRLALEWSRGDHAPVGRFPWKTSVDSQCPLFDSDTAFEINLIFETTKIEREGGPSIGYGTFAKLADDARKAAGDPVYGQPEPDREMPADETFAHLLDEEDLPTDLFEEDTLPELNKAMLPEAIADFAFDVAARLGVTPGMVAIPALAVCAVAIHDAIKIQPTADDRWRERANFWATTVAPSGAGKSPAVQETTGVLRKTEAGWRKEDDRAYAKWKSAQAIIKKSGCSSLVEEPSEPPKYRRIIIEDATVETLARILADNPRGLLLLHDELAGWFGAFDSYRNTQGKDRPLMLSLWNGGPKAIDRGGLTGKEMQRYFVENWSACIYGGIQPGALRDLLKRERLTSDGLGAAPACRRTVPPTPSRPPAMKPSSKIFSRCLIPARMRAPSGCPILSFSVRLRNTPIMSRMTI